MHNKENENVENIRT